MKKKDCSDQAHMNLPGTRDHGPLSLDPEQYSTKSWGKDVGSDRDAPYHPKIAPQMWVKRMLILYGPCSL
jgi:hypothetical protein